MMPYVKGFAIGDSPAGARRKFSPEDQKKQLAKCYFAEYSMTVLRINKKKKKHSPNSAECRDYRPPKVKNIFSFINC